MDKAGTRRVRCAVYTRKSSEEGLEQSFNSLHAQREACEAYVKSQIHEGWTVIPTLYDDGGFSGGSMERPALKMLLDDVRNRRVDVVVVYKIDRLTRSLFDFAKIVEIFDAASVSFVSVTQSFNTTTSMGRLTLNVLLSFAQFEREVTGERIRDKIAASKRKGMFVGGTIPIGYDLVDHRLVINEAEAATVRLIFDLYLRLGSVKRVRTELDRRGVRTKRRVKDDIVSGDQRFFCGHIYYLLRNPTYIGKVRHRQQSHDGLQPAIIDIEVWQSVQDKLASQASRREQKVVRGESASMLVGRVFGTDGRRLTPSYAKAGKNQYRYYETADDKQPVIRLPGNDLEKIVLDAITSWLLNPADIRTLEPRNELATIEVARALAASLQENRVEAAAIIRGILTRVQCDGTQLSITLHGTGLKDRLGLPQCSIADPIVIERPCQFVRRGKAQRLIIQSDAPAPNFDPTLAHAVLRARAWFEKLRSRQADSIADLARVEDLPRAWISQQLPLAFLAPSIVEAIASGRQREGLTVEKLVSIATRTSDWDSQASALT
jgi:site-specific DNA recombinase